MLTTAAEYGKDPRLGNRVRAGAEVVIEDSSLPVIETCP
jgi:hypothetical protein